MIKKPVHKFVERNAMDLLMYGYVSGIRAIGNTISIDAAIKLFMEKFSLDVEEYCPQRAMRTYSRMQQEQIDLQKSNKNL